MSVKSRILAIVSVLVLGAGGVVVMSSPAQAVGNDCPALAGLCIWDGSNFNGNKYHWTKPANGSCINIGGSWNDKARAARLVYGSVNAYAVIYADAGCTGAVVARPTKQGFSLNRYVNCANTYNSRWYVSISPCSSPKASSFRYFY